MRPVDAIPEPEPRLLRNSVDEWRGDPRRMRIGALLSATRE